MKPADGNQLSRTRDSRSSKRLLPAGEPPGEPAELVDHLGARPRLAILSTSWLVSPWTSR